MKRKHVIGYSSAAALGYIHGDIRGAFKAVKSYRQFTKKESMAPYKVMKRAQHLHKHQSNRKRQSININRTTSVARAIKNIKRKKASIKKRHSGSRVPTMSMHSGMGSTTVKLNVGKMSKHLRGKTIGRWRYTQSNKQNIISLAGIQACTVVANLMTIPKILTSTGTAYSVYQNEVALEQLNPYLTNTGSSYLGSIVTPLNDRFMIISGSLQLEMTNFGGVGIEVDAYVVQCKRVNNSDPVSIWGTGLVQQALNQSSQTIPGPGTGTTALPGYPIPTTVPQKPHESELFKQFWKTLSVKHFSIAGGSTEILNIDCLFNKQIKMETVRQYNTTAQTFMPGSISVFLVQRGQLVQDTTTSILAEVPTYGQTKLGIITQEFYTMCGVKGNSERLNVSTAYDGIGGGASVLNQTMISEIDTVIPVPYA